jgi:hypothetical protein
MINRIVPIIRLPAGIKNKCLKTFLNADRKQINGIVIAPITNKYEMILKSELILRYCTVKTKKILIMAMPKNEMWDKRSNLLVQEL